MPSQDRKPTAQERRAQLEQLRARQAGEERRRRLLMGSVAAGLVAVLVGALVWLGLSKNGDSAQASTSAGQTPAGSLAPAWGGLKGQSVDGVSANQMEELAYHIHAHLTIYVDGIRKIVPWGVGIVRPWGTEALAGGGQFVDSGSAFYFLHTHDDTGVIHIESPTETTYTLGQFFAEWNQPLSDAKVGPATGAVTVYVNGQPYSGDPTGITLTKHKVIQLDVGKVVPFVPFTFPAGL